MAEMKLTPMLEQYLAIKAQHPDSILFFRMGDFYEMFFEDAEVASRVLEITLTSRDKGSDRRVPMCGVPVHSAEGYLARLVNAGFRVAICEQVEDPKEAKGLVRREVVKVVTPGLMVSGGDGADAGDANYIVALAPYNGPVGIAVLDLSTGEFRVTEVEELGDLEAELSRLEPSELLLEEEVNESLLERIRGLLPSIFVTFRPGAWFREDRAAEVLKDHFGMASLDGFGLSSMREAVRAAGALLAYVAETQKSDLSHIRSLKPYTLGDHLVIDEATKRNLELVGNLFDQKRQGSLLHVLDRTRTSMGGRLLRQWLLYPLRDISAIQERLDGVEAFMAFQGRDELRRLLDRVYDIQRLISRLVMGVANGRDLLALKSSLQPVNELRGLVLEVAGAWEGNGSDGFLSRLADRLDPLDDVVELLDRAIREECPVSVREGGIIKEGFSGELDELLEIQRSGRGFLADMEARERERTGISTLKVGYNKVFGYYLEVSKGQLSKVPDDYIRKQTLANAERYITQELKELEDKILRAQERRVELEYHLFQDVRGRVLEEKERIQETAEALAVLDVLVAFAYVASEYDYVRPEITVEDRLEIIQGRHPVVERNLPRGAFVPNDVQLDEAARMIIITGPNMAGKSTVLRQTALIALMAQMGSFVPAEKAVVGVVDQIFTRVGATDYLVRGQSTFMVEMSETANILRNATSRSLVILDEIGRGTSTYDGLAIAWAVAESLLKKGGVGVKTLFATHYHELTGLEAEFSQVRNMHIAVREQEDRVVFLHQLVPGATNKSYGIQVAALAGVPVDVIHRAKELLGEIEARGQDVSSPEGRVKKSAATQPVLPLVVDTGEEVRRFLDSIDIDRTTPLDALNYLAKLKSMIQNG